MLAHTNYATFFFFCRLMKKLSPTPYSESESVTVRSGKCSGRAAWALYPSRAFRLHSTYTYPGSTRTPPLHHDPLIACAHSHAPPVIDI